MIKASITFKADALDVLSLPAKSMRLILAWQLRENQAQGHNWMQLDKWINMWKLNEINIYK